MQRTLTLSVISLSVLMFSSCGGPKPLTLSSPDGGKHVVLQVDIADTPQARSEGLKYITQMPEDRGMLFVFPQEQLLAFWMQDTKIPLDIVFFDAEGRFISGAEMRPCTQDPCPRYTAAEPGMYALEANSGFRVKNGIGMGWTLNVEEIKKISNPS
ncbi:MAG TPA: DUF192 domain-containing protein [Candidatus Peribacteria bacterium]|nr:DUF192 domain-containing protein [Candidatus Peribacteria bacterium]